MSKSTPNKELIGKGLRSLLQNIDSDYKNPAGKVPTATIEKTVASTIAFIYLTSSYFSSIIL